MLTNRGLEGINLGNEVLRAIEQELTPALGRRDLLKLRTLLRRLLVQLEEGSP